MERGGHGSREIQFESGELRGHSWIPLRMQSLNPCPAFIHTGPIVCKRRVCVGPREASILPSFFIYFKYLFCTHDVLGPALCPGDIKSTINFSWSFHSRAHASKDFTWLNPLNSHKNLCGRCYHIHFTDKETEALRIYIIFRSRIDAQSMTSGPFCCLACGFLKWECMFGRKVDRKLGSVENN